MLSHAESSYRDATTLSRALSIGLRDEFDVDPHTSDEPPDTPQKVLATAPSAPWTEPP